METQKSKSPHALFWIAGIAVTMFSVAGLAAIMGWLPIAASNPDKPVAIVEQQAMPAKPAAKVRAAPAPVVATAPVVAPAIAVCAECGVVESVLEIATKGEGTGVGVIGGAVVGGVLGNQVGGGAGKKIATVLGAVGGAVAGNEVEKQVKSTKNYEVTVRFEDGSSRVVTQSGVSSWRVGDRVRIVNGMLQSNT